MTTLTLATPAQLTRTIALCFLVALMEGLDLQAAGIAAQGMALAFDLDKLHMGWVFSAGIFGLLPGAFLGGLLADRIGRKRVLMASVALFGLFSLVTALAWDFNSLLLARCLTGIGLGAALPNLIALTSEVAGPRLRGTAVSLMYCGVPLGAALAAMIGIAELGSHWQTVFYVGGLVPLLIVPVYTVVDTHITPNPVVIVIGGLLTGIGTRLANGCTSGHGVCGISRLSLRGIVATVFYILVGGIVMVLARHVLGWI